MPDISNLLRKRLGARPQPQTHPDPDVLNAYVERVLPDSERQQVVLHLSECSYCREVVSFSLPQLAPETQPQTAFATSRFWIPAFRLGGAVAVIAVAIALVVEKPWKTTTTTAPAGAQQPAPVQVSQTAQPAPVVSTAPPAPPAAAAVASRASEPVQPAGNEHSRSVQTQLRAEAAVRHAAPAAQPTRTQAQAPQSLAVAGAPPSQSQQPPMHAEMTQQAMNSIEPIVNQSAPPVREAEYQSSSRDYVNTNALRNDTSSQDASGPSLMNNAPASQGSGGNASAQNAKAFPAISMDRAVSNAFDVNVVPPTTAPSSTTGSTDTTLKHSRFLTKVPQKVGTTVEKGAVAVFDKAVGQSARSRPTFAGSTLTPPTLTQPDNQGTTTTETSTPATQWRIDRGTLMKSTDSSEWHEAYPQSHNLQLKVLVTRGDQIWAGGNNATMIHSWDAGVDWKTFKIPNAGDITSINVDDGWQVKTSDGKTFVSNDHGQTWVPIEPEK